MGRYRKRPVVVDAMQWTGLNLEEVKEFVGEALTYDILDTAWEVGKGRPHVFMKIKTLEGDMEVSEKDFIIKGVNGEFYPCKPDIFQKTYMPESTEDKPIGRLIDADVLMADIRNAITEQSRAFDWINLINRQPTVYDVDEVIGGLYGLKRYKNKYDSYYENSMHQMTEFENDKINSTIDKAIKIVKTGGKNE